MEQFVTKSVISKEISVVSPLEIRNTHDDLKTMPIELRKIALYIP